MRQAYSKKEGYSTVQQNIFLQIQKWCNFTEGKKLYSKT